MKPDHSSNYEPLRVNFLSELNFLNNGIKLLFFNFMTILNFYLNSEGKTFTNSREYKIYSAQVSLPLKVSCRSLHRKRLWESGSLNLPKKLSWIHFVKLKRFETINRKLPRITFISPKYYLVLKIYSFCFILITILKIIKTITLLSYKVGYSIITWSLIAITSYIYSRLFWALQVNIS